MAFLEKTFVLHHVFENVGSFSENEMKDIDTEVQFNFNWDMSLWRNRDMVHAYISCDTSGKSTDWKLLAEIQYKLISKNGNMVIKNEKKLFEGSKDKTSIFGIATDQRLIDWQSLNEEYLVDGKITLEAKITVTEIRGLGKRKLRNFDESKEQFSDLVLVVKDQKFHVSKKFMAANAPIMADRFPEITEKSGKPEVILPGIDPTDFQTFLEVLHGDAAVNDRTVEPAASLARLYGATVIVKRCEKFLMGGSEKTLKRKYQLAIQYDFGELKEQCLSRITSMADIIPITPDAIADKDPVALGVLLRKSINFY